MSTNAPAADELTIRRAGPEDREAIITLARASLGWKEGDPNEAFFAWKHDENAFGTSPAWLSVAPDGRIAGLRVFLRWRFRTPQGQTLSAVRAVDTATHPDFQGRGIFTTLTLGALPDLRDDGIGSVESMDILKVDPISQFGTPVEIVNVFGGREAYLKALHELEDALYSPAA